MKKYTKSLVVILTCILGLHSIGYSQSTYKIQDTEHADVRLLGTSTLHKWEMDAKKVTGEAQFVFKNGSKSDLISITSLSFVLNVKDLKSDNKRLDKNAYEALKSDEYKEINYKLSSSTQSPEEGGYLLKTNGMLTIAGVTKDILMNVHGVVNENGTITCTGSYILNMTDYEVTPPSFLLGVMKTGDEITLEFTVIYKK